MRNLVIDTGFNRPECRQALCQGLKNLDVPLSCTDLFITHLHADHSGLVQLFNQAGCNIYMNDMEYRYLCDSADGSIWHAVEENFMREGMPSAIISQQFSNHARAYSPDPHFPNHAVHDGDVLHLADTDLHVIHTPGHTKGLCCLYLPKEEIFFTSDHILFDITPNIQIWYHMRDSLEKYLHSLDKVRFLPVKLALPGHRKGSTAIADRIAAIKVHHRNRLAEIEMIINRFPNSTAYEIASSMTWSMRGKAWKEFPPTQKWFAMGETLAHLEYLMHHERVLRYETKGVFRYVLSAIS
jgi:glyoxylase-like metal-dependent hydrolase (beta-lactamase superfamily II)